MFSAYMNSKKIELGLTNQELSNLSGIPKGTVDRILSKKGASPNLDTAAALVKAVGGSLDVALGIKTGVPDLPDRAAEDTVESLTLVRDITNIWWSSLAAINREKNSVYASSMKSRERWLVFSVAINCIFIMWLIYDILRPTSGWIQYDVSAQNIRQGFLGACTVCCVWARRIRA